jgi:phage/plasmid-like protein (TIGR03299 family)
MAHEFESGFFVKDAAWHKLGTVIEDAPSIEEGIRLAGLDWKVESQDLFLVDGRRTSQKAITRATDGKILGYSGKNFTPLQNDEAFLFFNDFLKTGDVSLETAGSLRGGERIWVLAKIKEAKGEVIKGDEIQRYFMLSNAHTRGYAVNIGFTDIRVVCKNTMELAERSEKSKLLRVHHSSQVVNNLEQIKDIVNFSKQAFVADLEKLNILSKKQINQKDIEKFVEVIFFNGQDELSKRRDNKKQAMVETLDSLIQVGIGSDIAGVRGTAYSLYNATTEFFTHYDGKSYDKRLEKLWIGGNKTKNEEAIKYLLAA